MLLSGGFSAADTEIGNPSEAEMLFFGWINQARENPLSMADSLGMDKGKILADLPDLHDILTKGMEPVRFDERIYKAAYSHALDMIERVYYASESPQGNTVADRMFSYHYFPVKSGESLGMISFVNFMDSRKAARLIFENMFREELKPDAVARNILNPEMKDAGVSLRASLFKLEGSSANVYVGVCDFGSEDTSQIELSLAAMLNHARKYPDTDQSEFFSNSEDRPAPDLLWSEKLHAAAKKHISDVTGRIYFSNISPEGYGPLDRAYAEGYNSIFIHEAMGAVVLSDRFVHPAEAAQVLYEEMLKNDKDALSDSRIKDAGVGFEGAVFDLGNGNILKAYVMVAELATDTSIFSPMMAEENYSSFAVFADDYFGNKP